MCPVYSHLNMSILMNRKLCCAFIQSRLSFIAIGEVPGVSSSRLLQKHGWKCPPLQRRSVSASKRLKFTVPIIYEPEWDVIKISFRKVDKRSALFVRFSSMASVLLHLSPYIRGLPLLLVAASLQVVYLLGRRRSPPKGIISVQCWCSLTHVRAIRTSFPTRTCFETIDRESTRSPHNSWVGDLWKLGGQIWYLPGLQMATFLWH